MEPQLLNIAIIWYAAFVFSVVCHEAAHAYAGFHFGDHTAHRHGLRTLNPVPHMQRSPIGMIVAPILSFIANGWMIGWASTPYDPYWAQYRPKAAALKTLAGPATNLLIALLAGVLIRIGIAQGFFELPQLRDSETLIQGTSDGIVNGAAMFLSILLSLNVILFIFNLIPIAPLDGTAIMEFLLHGQALYAYRALMEHPTVRVFGIFIAWWIMGKILGPVYWFIIHIMFIGV